MTTDMASRQSLALPPGKLYDTDFAEWAAETARLLRAGRLDQVDLEHLAEEIEDMGKNNRREVQSRLRVLLAHLLKWRQQPQRRSKSWRSTIATQRVELHNIFRQSPSLRAGSAEAMADVYRDAVEQASIETGLASRAFPRACPYTVEEILDRKFFPE
jgi:hypothetical protein